TAEFNIPPDHPDAHRCSGGGFGPVDKNGYGVSYIFSSEIALSFHVSSSFDCAKTSSDRFAGNIMDSMRRIRVLLESAPRESFGNARES
ncbi:unnamed protein product, partial [Dicrocoelium dendriticum]